MFLISHRGNLTGPNFNEENKPSYIKKALAKGYDVEIDVWFDGERFWLGHDKAQYKIDAEFLQNDNLWCHAKHPEALRELLRLGLHCFWHQEDDCTLTSKNYIWDHPKHPSAGGANVILCLPEHSGNIDLLVFGGICSDFISDYEDLREHWPTS